MRSSRYWAGAATTPRLAVAPPLADGELDPAVVRSGAKVVVTPPAGKRVRAIALYAPDGRLARLVPAAPAPATTTLDLVADGLEGEGRWAVSVIDRFGRESAGAKESIR